LSLFRIGREWRSIGGAFQPDSWVVLPCHGADGDESAATGGVPASLQWPTRECWSAVKGKWIYGAPEGTSRGVERGAKYMGATLLQSWGASHFDSARTWVKLSFFL
jgi:hypothetical protein